MLLLLPINVLSHIWPEWRQIRDAIPERDADELLSAEQHALNAFCTTCRVV